MSDARRVLRIAFLDANVDAFYGGQRRMQVLMEGLRSTHEVFFVTTGTGALSERMESSGFVPSILPASPRVNQFGGKLQQAGIWELTRTASEVARWSLRFGGWLRKNHIDVVVANDLRSMLLASLGSRLSGVPTVWSVRDNVRQARWHGLAAKLATKVVPVSEGAATVFSDSERASLGEKVCVIHNGVPIPQPRSDARKALREELGVSAAERTKIVALVGMLTPRKGHADALSALSHLREEGNDEVLLAVVGDEPAGYSDFMGSLKEQATAYGIGDQIRWLGFREDAIDIIAGSDLLILPSYNEGLPGVLIEALGVGIPAVAYDVAGASEIVDSGRTGALVPSGDVPALARAMQTWLGDDNRRREAGQISSSIMAERFSVATYVNRYEKLLLAVAGS